MMHRLANFKFTFYGLRVHCIIMCLLKQFLVWKDSSLCSQNIIIGHCLQLLKVIQTYCKVLVNFPVKVTKNLTLMEVAIIISL